MITAKALGAMPQFALEIGGARVLKRAFDNAGLPYHFIDSRDGYIPEHAYGDFIHEVSRATGQPSIGLLWARELSIGDYGAWGAYILAAPNLGAAIRRAQQVMPFHSTGENVSLEVHGNRATYSYRFSLPEHRAYPNIAFSTIGEFLDVFHHFVGATTLPRRILLDIPRPPRGGIVAEDVFGCPVKWNARRLGVEFAVPLLTRPRAATMPVTQVTFEDVVREFADGPPASFAGQVREILRLQIQESRISMERVAQSLDVGVRSLQRRLDKENTSFRDLGNLVRLNRAMELMRSGQYGVAGIASLLGYSSSNNFSRAFKSHSGLTPSGYMAGLAARNALLNL